MKLNKSYLLLLLAGTTISFAQAQTKKAVAKKPVATKTVTKATNSTTANTFVLKTTKDSLSYALGTEFARSLKNSGFELNVDVINKAISSSLKEQALLLNEQVSANVIQREYMKIMDKKNAEAKKPGEAFLAANKVKPNIQTTAEGVQYEVLRAGSGARPSSSDEVVVHYLGTLTNGDKFDSSYDRNEPLTLSLNRVIEGWKIGIPLMNVGAKYRFFIPQHLAYGERATGSIPAFSTLIFEVELLDIKTKNEG